jgi:hypothetical protein
MSLITLKDTTKYVRDEHSKGLISKDMTGLHAYKLHRERMTKIQHFETDINNIKDEILAIKSLLQQIADSLPTNR